MRFLACLFFHFFILIDVGVIGNITIVFFSGVVQGSQLRRFISSAIHAQMSSTQGKCPSFPTSKGQVDGLVLLQRLALSIVAHTFIAPAFDIIHNLIVSTTYDDMIIIGTNSGG